MRNWHMDGKTHLDSWGKCDRSVYYGFNDVRQQYSRSQRVLYGVLHHLMVNDLWDNLIWHSSSTSLAGVRLNLSTRTPPPSSTPGGVGERVHFLPLLSLHGSYERTARTLHYGTGATNVHAYRPLQPERALSGPLCSRQGHSARLEADGWDNETRGGEPGSSQRENGSPVNS